MYQRPESIITVMASEDRRRKNAAERMTPCSEEITIRDEHTDEWATDSGDTSRIGCCIECVKAVPVFSADEIEEGDHIVFAGAVYDHHAIAVEKMSDGKTFRIVEATNTLSGVAVGFSFGKKAKIACSDKTFDFSKQKIWVVVYKRRLYSKSEVSERANRFAEGTDDEYKYDLFDNNCEHFATYCVTGKQFSIQVTKFRLTARLFITSGFVGMSDEQKRNEKEFENKIICEQCYEMNKKLLSVTATPIKSAEDVQVGDIIRYSYYNLWHEAVVLEIIDTQSKFVKCRIAHYAFCGLFSHRTIKQEEYKINFDGQCRKLEYGSPDYNVYDPNTVVERALTRIGEQHFVFFSNDSSHYARWCKLKLKKQ